MTVRFNPPPGWPTPPATWVPHDDWLPDPAWPQPPHGWSFWTVTARPPKSVRNRRTGDVSSVSFPVATAAAQSTVSLAALFPERARAVALPTFGGYGTSRPPESTPSDVPTKAGREYYRPRGWSRPVEPKESDEADEGAGGSVLNGSGPARDLNGAPMPGVAAAGTPIDPTAVPDDLVAGTESTDGADDGATAAIRLSPILRLVEHPSGLRAQFQVGGAVAAALAEVMIPTIEAALPGAPHGRGLDPDPGRGTRRGFLSGLGRRPERPSAGRGGSSGAGGSGRTAGPLSITDLVRRAVAARRDNDVIEAEAIERALCSLHRHPFTPLRRPTPAPMAPVTPAEEASIRQKALVSAGATEDGLTKAEQGLRRADAAHRADALVRATNVARTVFAGRREALAEGGWNLLLANDPATVVAVVDEALRLSGSDVTCLDAGLDATTQRAYVTVLVRFAPLLVVGDGGVEQGPSGRPVWRARTPWERNSVYAAGLASAVLAAAKQVDCVALAADDVNVVVVRPTRNGQSVEPVYVGTLDREDVSLRHPDADPLPLVVASAVPHGIRISGPDREVTALDRAADVKGALRDIVKACRVAMEQGHPDA